MSYFSKINYQTFLISKRKFTFQAYQTCQLSPYQSQRSTKSSFLGKYKQDKEILKNNTHSNLNKELLKSHEAAKNNHWKDFSNLICSVVLKCEELPKTSPFKLEPELTIVKSHLYSHFIEMMKMCFEKSRNSDMKISNNHSGYYYIGEKGLGKSTLMKTTCLISSLMIPNFVPIFTDNSSPYSFMHYLKEGVKQFSNRNSVHLEEIVDESLQLGLSLGVFLDESQKLYTSKPWNGVHELLTSFDNCVFMTGKESEIGCLINSTTEDELVIIKKLGLETLHSLNNTKIQKRFFNRLTNYSDYCRYLDNRIELKLALFPFIDRNNIPKMVDIPESKEMITQFHIQYNGRIKGFFCKDFEKLPKYLPDCPIEREILKLFKKKFDPWNPIVIRETQISKLVSEFGKSKHFAIVIYNLIESKWILQVCGGFTLYSPVQYFII